METLFLAAIGFAIFVGILMAAATVCVYFGKFCFWLMK
jgi:hypothetical protein